MLVKHGATFRNRFDTKIRFIPQLYGKNTKPGCDDCMEIAGCEQQAAIL